MIRVLALLFAVVMTAHAADEWTTNDVLRQVAVEGLLIADWGQTRWVAMNDSTGKYHEQNPLLGEHPSVEQVDRYFIGWVILHPVVSHFLPREYREIFQSVTIFTEVVSVHQNITIGGVGYRWQF